ncbi:uncharacterized protein B0H64DRAFT_29354 [Chaetomium fimeti]|uniref:Uncharacterized protein n=1 Tax=Chaetomium fimeti TaxID=1854472 RepID=A0AAE0HQZ1_9PEZI|nr:hypothetical protein B0H64DRAFT_29354 [Chaetomium fimeti]
MAFPEHASSRFDDVQLPIVFLPDVEEEDDMESGAGLEVDTRPRRVDPEPAPAPQHPIPSMQQAFAESLMEATQGAAAKPKLRTGDAKARREELLDQGRTDPPPTALWRGRPGQKTHELCRLLAQISFGVYLLLHGMANSQILVVSILQGHIDEVDEFLETTLEDMELATTDMEDRIKHLKLPMDNIGVFERMLEDRNFRMQILDGNQKIEHILARAQVALKQTLHDLAEGLAATREFTIYLAEQQHGSWRRDRPDVIDIFDAMKGNTDGWFNAFMDLQAKGSSLNALIVRLTDIVSEMERRAGEVSRRTRFSVKPYSSPSPKHSPRPSDASSIMTPPTSPPPTKIPNSPPRLSLRLSAIQTVALSIDTETPPIAELEAPMGDNTTGQSETSKDEATRESFLMVTSRSPPPEESPPETPRELPPQLPPARDPRRLSKRPSMLADLPKLEVPKEDDEEGEEAIFYLLQPRTYTPQPPSPQPSPRIVEEQSPRVVEEQSPRVVEEQSPRIVEEQSPRIVDERPRTNSETQRSRVNSSASSVESAAQLTLEPVKPRMEQVISKPQVHRLRVVEIGSKTDPKHGPRLSQRPEPRPRPGPDPAQAPELAIPQDPEVVTTQRTSLRQRISLKTSPPESIQVPHPNAAERPLQTAPRGYQAPDSAYGSDMERPPVNSMASVNSPLADFSPPFIHPGMIPSPHSERQFFRPVQASPYSPLQQRPHTAGTVGPHHFPPPPRPTPSRMGMSMMSTDTTMTNQTGKSVKKKRSAFGWLKKAFALDDEERAAFEQRKREQTANNPYYEPKSQQFLDGRRIRPRPGY